MHGKIGRLDAERIATNLLANDLIERYDIIEGATWKEGSRIGPHVPKVVEEKPSANRRDRSRRR